MSKQSTVPAEALAFFKDPDASSVLTLSGQHTVAPVIRGQDLTDEEVGMGGGLRIVMHVIDRSPSMEDVTVLVIKGFGGDYVAAIKEARQDDVAALRMGGLSFSSDITPIWQKGGVSFHTVEDLPPLTSREYNPQKGSGTALYQAIIDGYHLALAYAAKVQQDIGIMPEIDMIVLTDGYNNCAPFKTDPVSTLIKGTKPELVRWVYFYFETSPGACASNDPNTNPLMIAKKLGFDPENIMAFAKESGESDVDYHKRFRRMMRTMSKVSASKGTSAVQAAAATPSEDVV